jgi:cell surface protein SprA
LKLKIKNILLLLVGVFFTYWLTSSPLEPTYSLGEVSVSPTVILPVDSPVAGDTMPYPIPKSTGNPYDPKTNSPLHLQNPPGTGPEVEYDPVTKQYIFKNKYQPGAPYSMSMEEYMKWDLENSVNKYWGDRVAQSSGGAGGGLIPSLRIGNKAFATIFGSNTIDIRPQGSVELIFGINSARREDPALDVKQQRVTNFDFQEKIQMNVRAKVGDKIDFGINYNTEASFDFDNQMKLAYEGDEDEILQLVEAGDINFPLNGTLITGSQTLFGLKTKWKFGKTTVSTVFSQQKSETKNITVSGGALTQEFYIKADDYEDNKHYFISDYFRDNYNEAVSTLPAVNSPINITKIEVWVTTIGAPVDQNRNIVALMDLGETKPYRDDVIYPSVMQGTPPDNENNSLYTDLNKVQVRDINAASNYLSGAPFMFVSGRDFEKVENARKLNRNEYTYNSKLGFISLNSRLNPDQVLAVAFQYTMVGSDSVYKVGEFSDEGINAPNNLIVKLLKSTIINTNVPTWDLMMKNVYSINAYQVNQEDFRFDVVYESPEFGVPIGFLTEGAISGEPLIRALGLDRLNIQLDPIPDGVFDFMDGAAVSGGTIQSSFGRIFFPVVEPFGSDLRKAIDPDNPESEMAYKYSFDSLYTTTKNIARQYPEKNRFAMEGRYKSSSGSEISLQAMNVPQGSVTVTAGGVPLRENIDYTVDYTLGRVKIINEGILSSGTPINISLESNTLFAVQTKTLLGAHVDYDFNPDLKLGATILNLTERPLTYKVNTGDEPISNTIWGLDGSYQKESRWLTKMIDKLPFIETKAPSRVSITSEFAHFIPGHPRALGKSGVSYIDDFDGSTSGIDMSNVGQWFLASTPRGQTSLDMFPESAYNFDTIATGFNRAKLAWYVIDPLFLRNNTLTPDHIKNDKDQQSNHFVREIYEREVFPNKEQNGNVPTVLPVLNLAYYPTERGMYNYDVEGGGISQGIDADGKLIAPETRWGGIMRKVETTDFESTNIEYIEFWLMDPFVDPDGSGPEQALQNGGNLYFNLGDISEDILRDGRKSYENGLPVTATITDVDTTIWGRVPLLQAIVNSFDNNASAREFQDVGYDGLSDQDEQIFFQTAYIDRIINLYGTGSQAYAEAMADPSNDNYHYFRGSDYDTDQLSILDRYKKFNNAQGNSPTSDQSPETYPTAGTPLPNVEDINQDNTLSEEERYFQYKVELTPNKMVLGQNHIADIYTASVQLKNGTTDQVKWYYFRIPVTSPDKVVGQIRDFKSIRFMRMFMKDFNEEAVLRFGTLDLVRNEWRKYTNELLEPGEYVPDDNVNNTTFDVAKVNIEENGKRLPINYVLPPGIEREINYASTNLQQLNEQAMVLKVLNLNDGDARAAFKTTDFDFRRYKKLNMYVHAEAIADETTLLDGELHLFIRLGTDFTDNYYEYDIPLKVSNWGNNDREAVWPDENIIRLELQKFLNAKQERNTRIRNQTSDVITMSTPYSVMYGDSTVTVKGTPTLSSVKTIMIGLRNPRADAGTGGFDDGLAKSGEIWVNELRVTDFDEEGGWAANTVIAADLADLGNVVIAGNISTAGFGSLEQKIADRQQETIYGYDIATNLEMGRFFPEKANLRIPVHFDYSESFKDPEFNPLNPDIKYQDDLATYETKELRDSIKEISRDYTKRTSFNVMNVKKMRTGATKQPQVYDIENFDFSYSYQAQYHQNIDIEYDDKRRYRGAIGYNYASAPKNYTPLSKVKFLRKYRSLALIRDFNFYLLPKQIGFRTDIDRMYNEILMRKRTQSLIIIEPNYIKTFTWNRNYDFRYDFSKSLKLDYRAVVQARIDEPEGIVDRGAPNWGQYRDSVYTNIRDFGRTTMFRHDYNVNYTVPINKIPLFNWLSATARYTGQYQWLAAPLSTPYLGNTIENSQKIQLNGTANLVSLYNKSKYLKKLNQSMRGRGNRFQGQRLNLPPSEGKGEDSTKTKESVGKLILDNTLKLLMGVRNVSFSYSEANGSALPGFIPSPDVFGVNLATGAPGWDYVFGSQVNIAERSARNGWISESQQLNTPFIRKTSQNLSGRISLEPFKSLRIEVSFNRNYTNNSQEYWRYDTLAGEYAAYSPVETGQFTISYMTWGTAFVQDKEGTWENDNFENFKDYLLVIANRLAQQNGNWLNNPIYVTDSITGIQYPDGYTATQRDVMLYSFLAAYSGQDPEFIPLNPFPRIPKPNWRITFNGLTQIEFIGRYFKNINISHSYRSTYSLQGFTSNMMYQEDEDGFALIRDELKTNYLPEYDFNMVSISEQFSPLINLDMTWENSLITKIAWRKTRNLSMSFSNNQLTEVTSNELIIGTGYRFKQVPLSLNLGGNARTFRSDINIKLDISIRQNKTILRKLIEQIDQISAGQRAVSINFSADYQFSKMLMFRAFYDQVINNPFVSNQYPNSNTNAGISLRFTLAQ